MAKSSEITVLGPGVSFIEWEADVQAALVKRGRLAHVFHNIDGIPSAYREDEKGFLLTSYVLYASSLHNKMTELHGPYPHSEYHNLLPAADG